MSWQNSSLLSAQLAHNNFWKSNFKHLHFHKIYHLDDQVCIRFGVVQACDVDPLFTYKMVDNKKLNKKMEYGIADNFTDKERVANTKIEQVEDLNWRQS